VNEAKQLVPPDERRSQVLLAPRRVLFCQEGAWASLKKTREAKSRDLPPSSHRFLLVVLVLLCCPLLNGCSRKRVHASSPTGVTGSTSLSSDERLGYASWYGHPYHGRRTSNGETYDMNTMTAAHRTLAFDSIVKVNNLDNGKDVTVRINDRGPFVEDRIIDLSYAAAKRIEMIRPGTAKVSLEVLKIVRNPYPFTIQVGSFRDKAKARSLQKDLANRYSPVLLRQYDSPEGTFFRVLVGEFRDPKQAATALKQLRQLNYEGLMVRLDR
jgi:rare lipoprotein A